MTDKELINEIIKYTGEDPSEYQGLSREDLEAELKAWQNEKGQQDIAAEQASAPSLRFGSYYDNKAYLDDEYNRMLDVLKQELRAGVITDADFQSEWEALNRDHNALILENEDKYGKDKKLDRGLVAKMDRLKADMGLKDVSTYDFINGVEDENGNVIVPPLNARSNADFQRAYTNMIGLKFDKPVLEEIYWKNPHNQESFKKWMESGYDDRLRANKQVAYQNEKDAEPVKTWISEFMFPYQTEKLRQGLDSDRMDVTKDLVGIGSMLVPQGLIGKAVKPVSKGARIATNLGDNLVFPGVEYGLNLADSDYDKSDATGNFLAQGVGNLGINAFLNKGRTGRMLNDVFDPNAHELDNIKLIRNELQDLMKTTPNKATTSMEFIGSNYKTPKLEDYLTDETVKKFYTKNKVGDYGYDNITAASLGFKEDQNLIEQLAFPEWMRSYDRNGTLYIKIPDFIPEHDRINYLRYMSELGNSARTEAIAKGDYMPGMPWTDDLENKYMPRQEMLSERLSDIDVGRRSSKFADKAKELQAKEQGLYDLGTGLKNANIVREVFGKTGKTIGNVPFLTPIVDNLQSEEDKVIENKDKKKRKKKGIGAMIGSSSSISYPNSASSMGGN